MSEAKLRQLVQQWQELRDRGDPPSSEELCRDCPELLPALRQRLNEHLEDASSIAPPRPDPLVLDPTERRDAEQNETLRRRLLLVALIYLTQWALYFAIARGADERPESYLLVFGEVTVEVTIAALLTIWRTWSHRTLRWLEAGLFGMILARIAIGQSIFLSAGVLAGIMGESDELKMLLLIDALGTPWLIVILVYGVFIPNRPGRSAAMVSIGLLLPLVLLTSFAADAGLLGNAWIHHGMRRLMTHLGFASAIAVFSSYGVDRLRRDVYAARQLGQYVLKRRLGQGGMGEVYLAEHRMLRRLCAVKLIRADRAANRIARQRFEREAQVMAHLHHPNIVDVFDYGVTPDGTFFYVMEYLSGRTLRELVEDSGPLPPAQAIAYLRQVSAAVGAAHRRGLIHRDIKPSNLIVIPEAGSPGTVKLVDFGLVHLDASEDNRPLTQEGRLLGTPAFMSPEQIAGTQGLDARSDIYSIGVVACFLLTGENPFDRPEVRQIFAAHLVETPALKLTSAGADLEAVVRCCLAKNPADRFADAESLERALAACAGSS